MLIAASAAITLPGWCADGQGSDRIQVRQAREDWEWARRQVTTDAGWRQWLQQETARIDDWIAVPRDREDIVAGWIHDFQDPGTGAFRSLGAETSCDTIAASDRGRSGCLALQRHRNIGMLQAAARLAVLTGERRYAEWAASQLDLYVRLYARQARPRSPVLFRQGLDEANNIPALADAVRLLRPLHQAARSAPWCSSLLRPMAATLLQAQRQVNNIAVWYASATAIVGMECDDAALLQSALHGDWSLERLLETGTTADGYWFELALGYQNYVVQAVHGALLAAALRNRHDAFRPVHGRLRDLVRSPLRVQFSGNEGPTINDSNRHPVIPDPALLLALRRMLPCDPAVRAALDLKDWDTLLDPPALPAPPLQTQAQQPGGLGIPGLRSLFLRHASWQALLRAGQEAPFHVHQDSLSYELKYGDTWLFRHSVTPAYGSSLHRSYYKLAPAHNTPLVNDSGTSNWFARPSTFHADRNSITAAFRNFQRGVTVQRRLDATDHAFTDDLQFSASIDSRNRLGAIWHTDCSLTGTTAPAPPQPLPAAPGFTEMRNEMTWQSEGSWEGVLDCGGHRFGVRLLASVPFSLSLASAPALGPARRRSALVVTMHASGDGSISMRLTAAAALAQRDTR